MSTKILKKLTVKTVQGKKLEPFGTDDPVGAERPVMTVYGRADGLQGGTNTLPNGDVSEFVKFKGHFAAYAGEMGAGDEYRSGILIMPEVASTLLESQLSRDGVTSVQFGFVISIKKTETTVGYEYVATPLMEDASDADPLAALRDQMTARLEAPAEPAKRAAGGKK